MRGVRRGKRLDERRRAALRERLDHGGREGGRRALALQEGGDTADGRPRAGRAPLAGERAQRDSVRREIRELAMRIGEDDVLTVVLIGHGSYDGEEYRFNVPGPDLTDRDLIQLFDLLPARNLDVASCHLYAPACTVRFALEHYLPAIEKQVLPRKRFHIHLLSDAVEICDTVGPYRKSLLYLVSRALETCHKMPILGLE